MIAGAAAGYNNAHPKLSKLSPTQRLVWALPLPSRPAQERKRKPQAMRSVLRTIFDMKVLTALCFVALLASTALAGPAFPVMRARFPKPQRTDYPLMARWLVHSNNWGVISTISRRLGGAPFGHTVSYSDGPLNKATGRLLFYLTTMDAAAQDLENDSRATLTISEAQLPGSCRGIDPEDPTCVKVAITGRLERVPAEGVEEAQRLLFARHPAMKDWPSGHAFAAYELHIETLSLLDYYGGAHIITPKEYFDAGKAIRTCEKGRFCRRHEQPMLRLERE